MSPSRTSWCDPSGPIAGAGLLAGIIVFGLITEEAAYGLNNPRRWIPDFLVGAGLAGFGLFGSRLQRGTGALLAAAGLTWWLGNLVPAVFYVHRGLLLHAISTYPGWRTTSVGTGQLALGYLFASWVPFASTDLGTGLFGLVVTAVAWVRLHGSTGRSRRPRLVALNASIALLVGASGGVLVRVTTGSVELIEPALLLYQAGFVVAAGVLALALRTPSRGSIADLVVEIGESRTSTIRDAMARLLDDPLLEIGYRQASGDFADADGNRIVMPDQASERVATLIGRQTPGGAVIVHDRTLLADSALLEAVTSVTRLSAANAELTTAARHQLTQLIEARHRLLTSEDEGRRRLSQSLHNRTSENLSTVEETLISMADDRDSPGKVAANDALDQLRLARRDLDTIARGLHPWESSGDLETALVALAAQAPVPVSVTVDAQPERREIASAIYYVCSEAVANAVKHSSADHIEIELALRGGALAVSVIDDGRGGADPNKGTGLEGLADRVAGLGGELMLESHRGAGTRLTATFSHEGKG